MAMCNYHHSFLLRELYFVILAEPARTVQQTERAFNNPMFGQNLPFRLDFSEISTGFLNRFGTHPNHRRRNAVVTANSAQHLLIAHPANLAEWAINTMTRPQFLKKLKFFLFRVLTYAQFAPTGGQEWVHSRKLTVNG
jgi:hypothetical protein